MKQNIRELLIRSERARKQIIAPVLSQLGLTPGQGHAKILYYLLQKDNITQKELADICGFDTANISRSIDKLCEMGFLTRESNPQCRRSFLIRLTKDGKEEAEKVAKAFDWLDALLCQDIPAEKLSVFREVLEQLCENLEKQKSLDSTR